MLHWSKLLIFVPVVVILVITPGPNTLYIVARSLHGGYQAGLVSCFGISLATLIHIAAAAIGITALLSSSILIFDIIKYAGAAYLIWIGIKTLAITRRDESMGQVQPGNLTSVFHQGFIVNLLNPKTAIFFLALLPQFIDPSLGRVALQITILGSVLLFIGMTSDCAYVLAASVVSSRLRKKVKLFQSLRYVAAGVYLLLGTATALETIPR